MPSRLAIVWVDMSEQVLPREILVETVANSLPRKYASDIPAIRQALNDTADSYRKDGWSVRDYSQTAMVADVVETIIRRS
jgi:hypothetical protein